MDTVREIANQSGWRRVYGGLLFAFVVGLAAIAIVDGAKLWPHSDNIGQLYGGFVLAIVGLLWASIVSDIRVGRQIAGLALADLAICLRQNVELPRVRRALESDGVWKDAVAGLSSEDSKLLADEVSHSIERWSLLDGSHPDRIARRVRMLTQVLQETEPPRGVESWESARRKARQFLERHTQD